ncbi:prepilin-type N-terminal cleavage/methylation domain-containing protein, partial [bacterium]|nr:prepilin-type N-terminal cleavage/methylation domain-containing protein [bacterium]
MINKKKFGFSLMELLLVMAIIAVILSIAFSVTKKGIENAYNRYFYTGYVGLYEALAETMISIQPNGDPQFLDGVRSVLDGTLDNATRTITAPNGIRYQFSDLIFQAV